MHGGRPRCERDVRPVAGRIRLYIQRLLEDHGIRVPHVYGWCDEPRAYAMAAVPGKPDFAGVPAADRAMIVDEYLQALARVHQLPIDRFVDADIIRGSSSADAAQVGLRRFEHLYRSTKVRPDPLDQG